MNNDPTTLDIVRNIENGNRAQAAEQITTHSEPARAAIAVLASLALENVPWDESQSDGRQAWEDAATTVVRTLNAGARPTTTTTAEHIAAIVNDGLTADGWDVVILENIAEYLANAHGIRVDEVGDWL